MTAPDYHIAIDGMLKQDAGIVNNLSTFSCKVRIKDCSGVYIIYAYDVEAMEFICADAFRATVFMLSHTYRSYTG